MRTEKPQKRLVGWKQYLDTLMELGVLYALAMIFVGGGLLFLLFFIVLTVVLCCSWGDSPFDPSGIAMVIASGILSVFSYGALSFGLTLFREAKAVEPVAPITRHNTGHLPEAATLVRGSDRPAADEEGELLRAISQAQETPPEQLLRSIQEGTRDV